MNVLRQLWADAQSVLRDMSVTQRVAVTFLVLTVAVWLTFAAWMGTTPGESGRRPLPMEVDPADINDVLAQLKAKGIRTAEYDYDGRRIIVNVEEEKNAVIALAEEGLLRDAHAFGFAQMLDGWAFSDTRMKSEESMRLARANEVARLIENLDVIKEAQVIYSDDVRTSLFGVAHKKTAAVRVRTKLQKSLTENDAETIISLVSAAKAGLDPRDVVVTDQLGNKFHTQSNSGLTAMAKQKWSTQYALDEELRRKLENLMRSYIPNFSYEGDVNAFPKHDVSFDYVEVLDHQILPGEVGRSPNSTYSMVSTKRPFEEPGVQPNARRVANMGGYGWLYQEETRENRKDKSQENQNSYRQTATKVAPMVKNLTVAAVIHLPFQLRRDDEGRPIQAVNEMGEPLIDPETRLPMWERESAAPLGQAQVDELKRQIAFASGIAAADIPEKIEVSQLPWMPPVYSPPGGEAPLALAMRLLSQHMTSIITFIFFALAVYIVYRYATRPIPTELEEYVEPEAMSLALTQAEDDDDDNVDEEWDNLRSKVTAAVQEDPKRAAVLLKRWMRKD
ncbi:MAG: hypothetical protein LUC93_10060 [Planctomycetaceae bacterium]|nr:hypothetical protein [Planctomycetaceae bacterium]